jgi:glutathione S-transferase
MAMKLYNLEMSPNSRKARAVIQELGLPVEIESLNVRDGKHKAADYLKLNPNGKMPTLVDGDFVVWESNAILLYLASSAGKLLPADPKGRAIVGQWLFWQSSHFGPATGKVCFERILKPMFGMGTADEAAIASGTREFETCARVLDTALENKDWIAGELSIADFSVAAWADFGMQAGLNFEKFPMAQAWFNRISERESFRKSAPKA